MKTEIALGASGLFLSLLGQTVPDFVPGLVSQFGALGLVFWMVIHMTMVALPKERKDHADNIEKLLEMHKAERAEMLSVFNQTLEQKRNDYKQEIEQQRHDFEMMLTKFSCKARTDIA